jgi:hypothetical protein
VLATFCTLRGSATSCICCRSACRPLRRCARAAHNSQ